MGRIGVSGWVVARLREVGLGLGDGVGFSASGVAGLRGWELVRFRGSRGRAS